MRIILLYLFCLLTLSSCYNDREIIRVRILSTDSEVIINTPASVRDHYSVGDTLMVYYSQSEKNPDETFINCGDRIDGIWKVNTSVLFPKDSVIVKRDTPSCKEWQDYFVAEIKDFYSNE